MEIDSTQKSRVYLFGAGISKAINDNAPLNNELLPMILTDLAGRNKPIIELLKEVYPSTKNLLSELEIINFSIDEEIRLDYIDTLKNEIPSIEDVLSLLDEALLQNRPLCQRHTRKDMIMARRALVGGISGIIEKWLDEEKNPIPEISCSYREHFQAFFKELPLKTSIITTNYDMVVDAEIQSESMNINYGFVPRGELDLETIKPINKANKQCSILKLHGSLNWLYCPYCNAIDVCYQSKIVEKIFEKKPKCCTGYPTDTFHPHQYRPMLIVPTMLKSYDNPVFASIWDKAEDKFAHADEIIIAGYSLPDADVQLRTRLTRALIRNREGREKDGSQIKIRIIDRDFGKDTAKSNNIRQHFARLLGHEIDYQPIGFENYVAKIVTERRSNH